MGTWFLSKGNDTEIRACLENGANIASEGTDFSPVRTVRTNKKTAGKEPGPSVCRHQSVDSADRVSLERDLWGVGSTAAEMRSKKSKDPDMKTVLENGEDDVKSVKEKIETLSPAARHYCLLWDKLKVIDGVLKKDVS